MLAADVSFREGARSDLEATFFLSERAIFDTAVRHGLISRDRAPGEADVRRSWRRQRALIEFLASHPGGSYLVCEDGDEAVAFARVVSFGGVEQLTELMVAPEWQGIGIGQALLERCWPGMPGDGRARVVIAAGAPVDLSLYTGFGVMPVAGHWHLRHRGDRYVERRAQEVDAVEPGVSVLKPERAVREWRRLEPPVLAHERFPLHDFFAGDRTCLACMTDDGDAAESVCWVSAGGEIGPAVAASPAALLPVVLAALDRVARAQEPEHLSIFCTTAAWPLLRRLRGLGFHVHWPSWILSSAPLPGLDRYLPTRPPQLL